MPSALPLPTISDHLTAAREALKGERDRYGDDHTGSLYDHILGPTAILFARQAQRDRDAFRSIYFDDADGDELTLRGAALYGIPRILDTYGAGFAELARTSAAAGDGQILNGTRILVTGTPPVTVVVSADTTVHGLVARVPIRAGVTGSGTAVSRMGNLSFVDPVYDPLWAPVIVQCSDGTDFEAADAYRARIRQTRRDQRNGYLLRLTQICQQQGAKFVLAFPSQYGLAVNDFADDFGINAIYVGDANYQSSAQLVNACAVALEGARVLGADLWVGGMTQSALKVSATVTLVSDPSRLQTLGLQQALYATLLGYFAPTAAGALYKRGAMAGAMHAAHPAVQTVSFTLPSSDPTIAPTNFPATLTRYTLSPRDISLTYTGPI